MNFSMIRHWLVSLCVLLLVGCGGGGSGSSNAGTPVLPGTGSSGGTATTPAYSLNVQLINQSGAVTTAVIAGQPVRAKAVLLRNGQAVVGELVQFSVEQTVDLVALDPVSGSQLTDDNGAAILTVSSLGASTGAGRVMASAKVSGTTVSGAANFFASGSVGSQPATLTLSGLEFDSAAVSAYGTTGIKVRVLQNGAPYTSPVTVGFTSSCASGKASITSSATTLPSGYAIATFVDNGCAQVADSLVTITATIGTDTKSGSMMVKSPTAGSLRFVSANPSDRSITLRGQGGNGRQENATLTFKLVDVAGNGVGDADVCFDATTYVGGLNLDGFSPLSKPAPGTDTLCGTDVLSVVRYVKRTNADGTISVQINSGTVPTPVRLRARTLYPATASVPLETYSDTLSISTGLPLQRSFSLSVDKANIDGWNFDGEKAVLTVRLADQFSNPVPDGTAVSFVASGGAVCSADNGSCKTANGVCSCDFVSQARRPLDGRVVVTAYAIGLEDFDDKNGNNQYDVGIDDFVDLGDAYVDANKDGISGSNTNNPTIHGDTDILIPYDVAKGFRATGDGVRGTAHLRASTVIYLSQASTAGSPTVVLPPGQMSMETNLITGASSVPFLRLDPNCPQGTPLPQATLAMLLEDGVGNPMAALTSLLAVDVSDNLSAGGFRPNAVLAIGARPPSPLIDQPNIPKPSTRSFEFNSDNGTVYSAHSVTVRGVVDKCSGSGSFGLQVTSPRGGAAFARVLYDGEPRTTARSAFPVRYRNPVSLSLSTGSLRVSIDDASVVSLVGAAAVSSYSIDWGDGTSTVGAGATLAAAHRIHTYAANLGNTPVTIRLTLTAGSSTFSGSQSVIVSAN